MLLVGHNMLWIRRGHRDKHIQNKPGRKPPRFDRLPEQAAVAVSAWHRHTRGNIAFLHRGHGGIDENGNPLPVVRDDSLDDG